MISLRALIEFEQTFEEYLAPKRGLFDVAVRRPYTMGKPKSIPDEPGLGKRPARTGRVGMMDVTILWMGATKAGVRRAKVQDSKGIRPPFWVDADRVTTL